jgi:tyrosinase
MEALEVVATRKNILSDVDSRNKFIKGVKLLKNDLLRPGIWPNTYDIFVYWHHRAMMFFTPGGQSPAPGQGGRNAAHKGPVFLPWHRWMLILLEKHLQRVLQDPNFGLPYWDWSVDGELPPPQQPLAPIWSNDNLGGSGSPVTTGPFKNGSWQVNVAEGPGNALIPVNRGLERDLGVDSPHRLPTKAEIRAAVNRGAPNVLYDSQPWNVNSTAGFRNELEGWFNSPPPRLHNLVHVFVGGDMSFSSSPNDPAFYLNHCNVDRIWAAWQQKPNNSPYLPAANAPNVLLYHRLNDPMRNITSNELFDPLYKGTVTPAQLLNTSQLYKYDNLTIP